MKLNHARTSVTQSGDAATSKFRILASAKAFEILSSSLYERKHEAIVRELCCNAVDAHVKAGTPERRFELKLPDEMEPYLAVRDFGPGLSPDDVESIYTVYFASDKTGSDDYVGQLGLGAKSPFAYTDQFQVTSWNDGVKYVYTAFKNSDGFPELAAQAAHESDEPSGVEVRLAVVKSDFYTFMTAARTALRYFRVMPVVNGGINWQPEHKPTYAEKTDWYGVHGGESRVVMGDVAYPIDGETLGLFNGRASYYADTTEGKLVNHGIDLFLPIGAVSVAASRESLSYDPRTIKKVVDTLTAAGAHLAEAAVKDVESAPTFWQANVRYTKHASTLKSVLVMPQMAWNGRPVTGGVTIGESPAGGLIQFSQMRYVRRDGSYKKKTPIWQTGETTASQLRPFTATGGLAAVFSKDVTTGHIAGAKRFLEGKTGKYALMFDAEDLADGRIVAEMGWEDLLIKVSDLPKPEIVRTPRAKTERTKVREWKHGNFQNAEIDLSQGGVYIVTMRDDVLYKWPALTPDDNGRHLRGKTTYSRLNNLEAVTGNTVPIYGLIPSELPRLKKHAGWVHFDDYAKAQLQIVAPKYMRMASLVKADQGWYRNSFFNLLDRKIAAASPFAQYLMLYREFRAAKDTRNVSSFISLADSSFPGAVTITPAEDYVAAQAEVAKRYPLLFRLSGGVEKSDVGEVLRYIRLVDAQHKGSKNADLKLADVGEEIASVAC